MSTRTLRLAVAVLAAGAFLWSAINVPYRASFSVSGDNLHAFVGDYPMFNPPSKKVGCESFGGLVACGERNRQLRTSVYVDWHAFLVRFLTIAAVATCLLIAAGYADVLLPKDSDRESKSPLS